MLTKQDAVEAFVLYKFIDNKAIFLGEAAAEKLNQVLVVSSAHDIHFIANLLNSILSANEQTLDCNFSAIL